MTGDLAGDRSEQQSLVTDKPLESFRSLFDNIFSAQRPLFSLSERVWNPPADVYETAEFIIVKMEVAGMCPASLEVTAHGNYLIVRGCRHEDAPLPKENYHLMEIRYGHFERVFSMPIDLGAETIQARYENGFLVVRVSKAVKGSGRRIRITVTEG